MKKLIVFLLAALFFSSSYAAIQPQVSTQSVRFQIASTISYSPYFPKYANTQAEDLRVGDLGCKDQVPKWAAYHNTTITYQYVFIGAKTTCRVILSNGSIGDIPMDGYILNQTSSTCPANSTLTGSTCTCNSGYVEQAGQCVQQVDACAQTQGLTTGFESVEVQFDNVNPSPSALGSFVGQTVTTGVPINGNNCAASGVVQSCALAGTTLFCILSGTTYSGTTYNNEQTLFGLPKVDPDAIAPDELTKVCPTGQYPGQVNGTQVCVKSNGSANTTQSTTTNPDGTTSTTTTTTSCVGDECTSTTTTTTKDAQGNTTGTGTSTTEGDKDVFCQQNPEAPECKNTKSGFSGTCDAAFTCESEDAVQCAIALDQYKTNCEILKKDENLGVNLANIINDPLNDLDIGTLGIDGPESPGGSSCSITPFSIQVGIGAFLVDFTHLCAYLGIIKAIVTAFGFVMWTLIVFVRPS